MITALLVRWAGGWAEITDAASIASRGRSEALLGLGAAQSLAEVDRIARGQLATYASPRTEITADLIPIDDSDTPYLAFRVGDSVTVPDWNGTPTLERVVALTVAEDENGAVTYSPELKDVILSHQERLEQAMKKMADGTLRGNSAVATPAALVATPSNRSCCPPTPPGVWGITSQAVGEVPGTDEANHRSETWISDITTFAVDITVEGNFTVNTNQLRIALCRDGEGPEALGGVGFLIGGTSDDGGTYFHETAAYPAGTTINVGDNLYGYSWPWDAGFGVDPVITNLRMTVRLAGNHDDINLTWGGV